MDLDTTETSPWNFFAWQIRKQTEFIILIKLLTQRQTLCGLE